MEPNSLPFFLMSATLSPLHPGLVWPDGLRWVSYCSSHEARTSIHPAKAKLPSKR